MCRSLVCSATTFAALFRFHLVWFGFQVVHFPFLYNSCSKTYSWPIAVVCAFFKYFVSCFLLLLASVELYRDFFLVLTFAFFPTIFIVNVL